MMLVNSLMRAEEVAQMLNIEVSTVYEWARMRYIPSIRMGTGKRSCVRFDREEVELWLESKRKEGRLSRIPPR